MSFASVAFPVATALPTAEAVIGVVASLVRPMLGLGVLAAFAMIFKPLLTGLLRAALLVIRPRKSIQERTSRRISDSIKLLNRMARELDGVQPNQAAELRSLAARGGN